MEIREYIFLIRKWIWLLLLGAILGAAAAYFISARQPVIYETSTKIMVNSATDQENSYYYYYNDVQLAKTYSQILNTGPVLQILSEKLDYTVNASQVTVKQITDSLLLEISVRDGDPQRAANIANSLVEVFIEYNENMQLDRYEDSEISLQTQINDVSRKIDDLESEMSQVSQQTLETQKQQVATRIQELEKQLNSSEQEIINLESQIAALFPIPVTTKVPSYYPTRTPLPVPTPTLNAEESVKLKELQNQLDQVTSLRDSYKQVYVNLLVLGDQTSGTDPVVRQEQLQATLALYQQIYSSLLSNYENIRLSRMRNTPNIAHIEIAQVPTIPIQPKPLQNVATGALSGFIILGVAAFLIEYLDDTLKTPEDITRYLKVPVIGLIGEMDHRKGKKKESGNGIFVADNPLSPITEAFRSLRTNLDFASVDHPLKTLVVTSAGPSEGKTTIAVNLAVVMAQGERKVILIDADLRRPSVHRLLGIPNRRGLSDVFRDHTCLPESISSWGNPGIYVITGGGLPPNPAELLGSERMHKIIQELQENSDILIIDTPPAIVADPIVLSAKADGVVVIIEPGKTRIGAAQILMEQLQRAGARVIGVVLNPISRRRSGYYSKYHYYSTYHYYSRSYDQYSGGNGSKPSNGNEEKPEEEQGEAISDTHPVKVKPVQET